MTNPIRAALVIGCAAFAIELGLGLLVFDNLVVERVPFARVSLIFALTMSPIMAAGFFALSTLLDAGERPPELKRSKAVDTLIYGHIAFSFQILIFPLALELGRGVDRVYVYVMSALVIAAILGSAAAWLRAVYDQTEQSLKDRENGQGRTDKVLLISLAFGVLCLGLLPVMAAATQQINWQKAGLEAEVLNLAGRQRMLSQRVVLLSNYEDDKTREEFSALIEEMRYEASKLTKLTNRMAGQFDLSASDRALLPGSPALLSLREHYLSNAEFLLNNPGTAERSLEVRELQNAATELLTAMERSVFAVKTVMDDHRADLQDANKLRVALGPVVFLGLAIGLFWPLLRLVRVQHLVLEDSRREAEDASTQAMAAAVAKSQFLATMSHEIRTPMNGVIGMLDVLLHSNLDAHQKEQASVAKESAQCLLTVINDILDFSKLEAGKVNLEYGPMNPKRIIEDVVALLNHQATEKGVDLNHEIDGNVPDCVEGDGTRFRQLLVNLIGNGIKFTREGSVHVVCLYRDEGDGPCLKCEVKDTGIGISQKDQEKLFQRFSQVDASTTRNFGGTGLGLAICRQLAELMGGEIGVKSKPGAGSNFWFTLPARPLQAPGTESFSENSPTDSLQSAMSTEVPRVLVAEDNVVNQKIIVALLKPLEFQITLVNNGAEALAAINEETFDLILMDIQMPVMDGIEATRAIRALKSNSQTTPIIAVTANAMPGDRERYLAEGMDEYVSKPIEPDELIRAITACLSSSGCTADAA